MGTGVAEKVKQSQTDRMIIQVYLAAVRMQPDIVSDYAPGLPAAQKQARSNADLWDEEVWPSMTQTVTDLLSFSTQWINYSELMTQYAHTISRGTTTDKEKTDARHNLDSLLGVIYVDVNKKYQNVQTATDKLKKYSDTIRDTNSRFDKELRALQEKFASKTGVLAQLDGEIANLNGSIGSDIALVVGSVVGSVVGIGLVVVGLAVEFETAGTSTTLVVAGVTTIAASIGVMASASADINSKAKSIAKLTADRAADEILYASVKTMIDQVASLDDKCESAKNSANNLMIYWADLKGEIETLRADIKAIKPGDFAVLSSIAEANADFEAAKVTCQNIQTAYSGGNPPVKKEEVKP